MQREVIRNKIEEVMVATFEKLAFLFLIPLDGECDDGEEETLTVKVDFEGPQKGSLYLKTTKAKAKEIAENMLGIEDADDEKVAEDALKECANILCGNILPELFGKKEIFKIYTPLRYGNADKKDTLREERGLKLSFELEDGECLTLVFELQGSIEQLAFTGDEGPHD